MCQYSALFDGEEAGRPNEWHTIHYGARAHGGAGMIILEATAVEPTGRISPFDLMLHRDEQIPSFAALAHLIEDAGSTPAIQLGHAGRKASCSPSGVPLAPKDGPIGGIGWVPYSPSAIPFTAEHTVPKVMGPTDLSDVVKAFTQAARRAVEAGFKAIEIHAAHGYLLHQFLSPVTNDRRDDYGGPLENRARLALEVTQSVRAQIGEDIPLMVRISATDWIEENPEDKRRGLSLKDMAQVSAWMKEAGADLIDVSTGGIVHDAQVPAAPGYQVAAACTIRQHVDIPVSAVGLILEAPQAEQVLVTQCADVVSVGRPLLTDPLLPMAWASRLSSDAEVPTQYLRGTPRL